MLLTEAMETWLTIYKRPTLKITSYDTLYRTAKNYIFTEFENREIEDLTSIDIQKLLNKIKFAKQLSYSTLKKVYNALNAFYKYAVMCGLAASNIVEVCKIQDTSRKSEIKCLSLDEIGRFTRVALSRDQYGDRIYYYGPLLVVYLHTGLRLGELIGCELNDYDPDTGTLHIHGNVAQVSKFDENGLITKGSQVVYQDTPKTRDSERIIQLNQTARTILKDYYIHSKRCNSNYLITSPKKTCASPSSLQSTYKYIAKKANVESGKGIHSLRHTCATFMLSETNDIKSVSKVLGHASVTMTYNVYIHKTDKDIAKTTMSLDRIPQFCRI